MQLVNWYKSGRRLSSLNCEPHVYKIMSQCWNILPSQRPTFVDLSKQLNDLHMLVSQRNAGKVAGPTPSTGSTSSAASNGVTSPQTPKGVNFFTSRSAATIASPPITPISSMPLLGSANSSNKPVTPPSSIATASSQHGPGFPSPSQQPANGFPAIPSIMGSNSGGSGSASHTPFPSSHSQWTGPPLAT